MPRRTRRRQFDHQVFGVCSPIILFSSLHVLLFPFILYASVYFWQIWQKGNRFVETGCSLSHPGAVTADCFRAAVSWAWAKCRHQSLSSWCSCLPCGLGALQSQQLSPRHALWVFGWKTRENLELENKDKRGTESSKGKYFICLTLSSWYKTVISSSAIH